MRINGRSIRWKVSFIICVTELLESFTDTVFFRVVSGRKRLDEGLVESILYFDFSEYKALQKESKMGESLIVSSRIGDWRC